MNNLAIILKRKRDEEARLARTSPQAVFNDNGTTQSIGVLPHTHSEYAVLSGASAPTTSTVGALGQFYLETTTPALYQCTAVGATYTWTEVGGGGSYTLPQATGTTLGGIVAATKTTESAEVKIDAATGKLYVPAAGEAANGVAPGGTAGQVYTKIDGTDYNAEWAAAPGGVEVLTELPASPADNQTVIVNSTGVKYLAAYLSNAWHKMSLVKLLSDPTEISGCIAWFDASQLTGADATAISQWDDLSGNSNHLIQATAAKQPTVKANGLNNKKTVLLDGTDDFLAFAAALTTIRTAVFVVEYTGDNAGSDPIAGHATLYDWHGTTNTALLNGTYASPYIRGGIACVNGDFVNPMNVVKPTIHSILAFVTTANVAIGNIAQDRNTAGSYWKGEYAEIILYNKALSQSEMNEINAYLKDKWGIA